MRGDWKSSSSNKTVVQVIYSSKVVKYSNNKLVKIGKIRNLVYTSIFKYGK